MSIESEAKHFKEETGVGIPKLLVDLYSDLGNGGFGPQYGMLGIDSGHETDMGDHMLSLYKALCTPDPEDPNWHWPRNLIPFIHIGCAIYLCVDTSNPENRIVRFDPNGYSPGGNLVEHFSVEGNSLKSWMEEQLSWP